MNIALVDYDSKLPNLALMKIAAYYKSLGHHVDWLRSLEVKPDKIFVSVIFPKNKNDALGLQYLFPTSQIYYGGSGINYIKLPYDIEHIMPDYSLYNINYSMGFITRGCIRDCPFCIVRKKEGPLIFNANLKEFLHPKHKQVILMDNNPLAFNKFNNVIKELIERDLKVDFNQGLDIRLINKENAKLLSQVKYYNHHFNIKTLRFSFDNSNSKAQVLKGVKLLLDQGVKPKELFFYILAYPDHIKDAVNRVNLIKNLGCRPFVMGYNQIKTKELTKLRRWVNHFPYYQVFTFDEFKG